MTKKADTSIGGYRYRLQSALLGPDIAEIVKSIGEEPHWLVHINRERLLALWDPTIEDAIIRKLHERLRPR